MCIDPRRVFRRQFSSRMLGDSPTVKRSSSVVPQYRAHQQQRGTQSFQDPKRQSPKTRSGSHPIVRSAETRSGFLRDPASAVREPQQPPPPAPGTREITAITRRCGSDRLCTSRTRAPEDRRTWRAPWPPPCPPTALRATSKRQARGRAMHEEKRPGSQGSRSGGARGARR